MDKTERLKAEADLINLSIKYGKLPSIKELAKHFSISIPAMYQDFVLLRATGLTTVVRLRRSKGAAIEEVLNGKEV